ncbi:hypothetical protein KKI99_15915 [Xenorhabdus bovienii]|nr:hypothetical protein [Xenorhabdus bovienii]
MQVNSFSDEVYISTAIKNAMECKEDYLNYRKQAMSDEPRSRFRRAMNKLAWQQRKYYRKWAAIS